jgi:hypothetical protein
VTRLQRTLLARTGKDAGVYQSLDVRRLLRAAPLRCRSGASLPFLQGAAFAASDHTTRLRSASRGPALRVHHVRVRLADRVSPCRPAAVIGAHVDSSHSAHRSLTT